MQLLAANSCLESNSFSEVRKNSVFGAESESAESESAEQIEMQELRETCLRSYRAFCALMQEEGWFDPVHAQLCDFVQWHIEEAWRKEGVAKILLVMPRGFLKSTIVTKYLPVWLSLRDPNTRSLIVTNTHDNGRKKLEDIRSLYERHDIFRSLFPELLPTKQCRWTNDVAEIRRPKSFPEGTFEAAGRKTRKIGTHYNLIVEDDTVAPEEDKIGLEITAPTLDDIEGGVGYHRLASALMVPKGPRARVIVTTRWAEFDLASYVQDNENYHVFDVPAELPDGTPRFTMFYNKDQLQNLRESLGEYMYSCLILNKPVDASQRKFQEGWFNEVDPESIPAEGFTSISIDPAVSEKDDACETAITAVRHCLIDGKPHQFWFKDIHGHFNPRQTVVETLDLAGLSFNTKYIVVEANGYQATLKYDLHDEMTRRMVNYPIVLVHSRQQKNARIEAMIPFFSLGRIHFVKGGLTKQVHSQLIQFPKGRLVDIVDSFAQHLEVYKGESSVWKAAIQEKEDPMSFDFLVKEIKKRGKEGVCPIQVSPDGMYFSGMPTGLGHLVDLGLEIDAIKRERASRPAR